MFCRYTRCFAQRGRATETVLGAVLLTVGRSYVGNDVTRSTLLDTACACSYENLPKYRSYRVRNMPPRTRDGASHEYNVQMCKQFRWMPWTAQWSAVLTQRVLHCCRSTHNSGATEERLLRPPPHLRRRHDTHVHKLSVVQRPRHRLLPLREHTRQVLPQQDEGSGPHR